MNYTIKRSARKTLCLTIDRQGNVVVRAPRRCSKAYIDRFVKSKQSWIADHQARVLTALEETARFDFSQVETIPFCGKALPVIIDPGKPVRVTETAVYLPDIVPESVTEPLLRAMGQAGYPWLKERLDHWAGVMGISYRELKLSSAKHRWGSCTKDGIIRISRILLLAPERCIDYVLVHELAHRRVFNHSAAFHAVVAEIMPDAKKQRARLNALHGDLRRQGFIK